MAVIQVMKFSIKTASIEDDVPKYLYIPRPILESCTEQHRTAQHSACTQYRVPACNTVFHLRILLNIFISTVLNNLSGTGTVLD
jgi:hypothetical protein